MDAALDDAFIDDITFPAVDGYSLTGTLFLPRGAKRRAVLINFATAGNATRGRVALFGFHRDQAGGADGQAVRCRRQVDRPFRLLPPEHRDTLWRGMAE
jgi:hypothetical protein